MQSQPENIVPDAEKLKRAISRHAEELGFDIVRFTAGGPFPDAQKVLEERIDRGLMSGLTWFTRERAAVAGDPRNLLPGVRTIVSLGISYLSEGEYAASQPGD